MQLPLFLLGFGAVFATAAFAEDDCRCWTPNAEQIAAAEAKIGGRPLPLGGLDRYARYYAGTIDSDRRFIRGKLVPAGGNDAPGIHIVEGRMLPLQGEGCVANSEPGGGPWLYLRCAHPGAWTPNDGQIAELEGVFHLPDDSRRAEKASSLFDYARHYAGVTEGDRRIVVGVFVIPRWHSETAGIYIESEAELPMIFDGGCGVITVRYDPSTKEIRSLCNGVG
jgi:hypothetical protein